MTVMDIEELLIFNHGYNKQEAITQYLPDGSQADYLKSQY